MDIYMRLSTLALLIHFTVGHVIIYRYNQTIEEFYDLPAQFGPPLTPNGLKAYAVESHPRDACKKPQDAPTDILDKDAKFVLVIARTNCTFEEKIRNAQLAGYDGAIVYNIGSDDLEQMSAKNGADIKIPSVFVGENTGNYIIEGYYFSSGFYLVINDELPFNINTHLILPFSILVGFCFIIMIVYMIYKCAREQRRLRQHRLPKRLLKKIPTIKFTKGQPFETCVICLDEYVEGDKLRILPCQHAYHCDCIDTWLTKNRRVCPICKRKVFAKGESSRRGRRRPASSDSMSDSETDDTTPLLNPVENSNTNNHGTFNNTSLSRQQAAAAAAPENENGNVENQTSQRPNPFDRVINPSGNVEEVVSHTFNLWNSISRLFRRNRSSSHSIENPIHTVLENAVRSVAVGLPSRPSSNNILNTNLSGSFKDDEDDEQIAERTIYEPIQSTSINVSDDNTTVGRGGSSSNNNNESLDSVFIQTPSHGGIGVAAIPNTSSSAITSNTASSSSSRNSNQKRVSSNFIV